MILKRYAAMLLAALVVTAGAAGAVAAAPGSGNAPDDAGPNENANDAATDDADGSDGDASSAGNASAADERRGPPTDMPEQVPDHVGEIHSLINQFINGSVSDLGSAVSDVTPDDGSDANDGDASNTESANDTPA